MAGILTLLLDHVNSENLGQLRNLRPVLVWSDVPVRPTFPDVPRIREEDRQFAERLAGVLRELRAAAGWTQEKAAEQIGVPISKVGRWERADFAPKGYDLGRLYRAYVAYGADWRWFFDPAEIVVVNPVRAHLDELARGATALALEDLDREQATHRAAATRRVARRDKRPA